MSVAPADSPFEAFFNLVPTGAALYAAVYDAHDELVDFRFVRLNPAGQRLLGLPAQPSRTFREYYPNSVPTGIFAQYRTAYLTGRAATYDVPYEGDGLDTYFRLVAQRSDDLLVVNFTDMGDLPRSAVEQSLLESRAREQAARAEAEAERQRLYQVLMSMPANIALLRGPEHTYDLVNPEYERLFPARIPLGRTIREVIPELEGQGFYELFDRVYQTGEPYYQAETEAWADYAGTGELQCRYYRTAFEPIRNAQGAVVEVLNFAVDVTAQVEARQQAEHLSHVAQATRAEAEAERQRFYEVLMQLPAQVAINRGPAHVFDLVNPRYQQLFPARAVLGLPVRAALPELAGQQFFELLDRVYQTGEPFYGQEMPADVDYTNSGRMEPRYFDVFFQALHDAHGRVNGILNFAYDVTEQVLARRQVQALNEELAAVNEELQTSNTEYLNTNTALQHAQLELQQLNQGLEDRVAERTQALETKQTELQEIFEQAPVPIVILAGPDLVFQVVNPAYQQLFPERTLLGQPLQAALPELVGSALLSSLQTVYQTGEPFAAVEMPVQLARHANGPLAERYWSLTCQARRTPQGVVDGVRVFTNEVTDQVQARQQLEHREASFRIMADAAPAMLWVTDPDGQCTYLNAQWYLFTGQTEAEALGLGWTNAVHPDDAEQAGQKFLDANARRVLFHLRYRLRRHDGVYRWATDTGWPRFTEDGEYAGIVGTVIDVHEQQLAEEELLATNQQLTRTNVDLDTFVYTASHDLKAPITNIESIALALRDTLPAAVQQEELVAHLLDLLGQTITRFQFTIGQLTDISRLQLAHAGPAEPVRLAAVVEDVRLDLAAAIAAADTQLAVEVPPGLEVSFSPANLRSIVYNLLSNAIKYRIPDQPSHVRVHAEQTANAVVLIVQDNGLGMSAVQQRQLYGLFQRLHTHVEGTGVGLYITKRLVENAGGTITVQSQPNAGTTFTVTFPS